ncbi:MAG: Asp-tRNA(Asn)/Glu-tRNA(Gln) amidotransferase subunit GatA [Actinobacteria bacterium]|nr:Asp-tRNA(Asn)/Glu-tRNA(Gln) amidotransferase subunit GatA [Actinomycetota bacterium]
MCDVTASELGARLRAGGVSAVEITESCLTRMEAVEDRVRAFLTPTAEMARERAAAIDERIATGAPLAAVAGIPLALKDVLTTRGIRTTCGSRILENYVPPYDCTSWARLAAEGSVLVGKTSCDEFAMGSSNENSAFGPVHNPWDLDAVPGGSSGGSAAAVASGEAVWALGTDTGGSVRQPASLCGVVGLKPTYGLVSRYGLIAFASSLDTVGQFARSVRDAAILLSAVAGKDPRDATSLDQPKRDYTEGLDRGVAGLRVGVIAEAFGEGVQPGVRDAVRAAVDRLARLGAEVGEVSLPHTDYALSAYYLIAPSEASSNLARYDGVRYGLRVDGSDSVEMMARTRDAGFGPEVKRRIMLGTYALSAGYYEAYYGQAQKVRTLIIRDYEAAFERFDVLASPTSPTTAFRIGEKADDPLAMYLNDVFTIPANLAGVPSISVPCGFDETGLPVGAQFTARVLDEPTLLRAAHALEQDLALTARPPLVEALA